MREQYPVNLACKVVHVIVAEEGALYIAHLFPARKLAAVDVRRARPLGEISVALVAQNIPGFFMVSVTLDGFPHLPRLRLSEQLIFLDYRYVLEQQSRQGNAVVFVAQTRGVFFIPVDLILVYHVIMRDALIIKKVV